MLRAARRSRVIRAAGRAPAIHAARRRAVGLRLAPVSNDYGFDRGRPSTAGTSNRSSSASPARVATPRAASAAASSRSAVASTRTGSAPRARSSTCCTLNAANPEATIIGDLTDERVLEEGVYDCIICTQTLQVIWDVPAALRTLRRGLKPDGVLFITVPGITKACLPDRDHWGDSGASRELRCGSCARRPSQRGRWRSRATATSSAR